MELFGILFCFILGAVTAAGIIAVFQKELLFDAAKFLRNYAGQIHRANEQKKELKRQFELIASENLRIQKQIDGLHRSNLQLVDERNAIELAWAKEELNLQSTNRVLADEAIIFGRGREWVYLYTFPVQEQLAHERRLTNFPMKLGMSTQDDVVTRVHQQVSGNSTAISERAIIRRVFRVNDSRDLERRMHGFLIKNGRQVTGSVGVEWFNTNPLEVEQLFRSYVLTYSRTIQPIAKPTEEVVTVSTSLPSLEARQRLNVYAYFRKAWIWTKRGIALSVLAFLGLIILALMMEPAKSSSIPELSRSVPVRPRSSKSRSIDPPVANSESKVVGSDVPSQVGWLWAPNNSSILAARSKEDYERYQSLKYRADVQHDAAATEDVHKLTAEHRIENLPVGTRVLVIGATDHLTEIELVKQPQQRWWILRSYLGTTADWPKDVPIPEER